MQKIFFNRFETDGYDGWERKVSQYDNTLAQVSLQDKGDTLKVFIIPAQIITVKLNNGVKLYVGNREIKTPYYKAPSHLKKGDKVLVPIGDSNFNEATVVKVNVKTDLMCRAIDNIGVNDEK